MSFSKPPPRLTQRTPLLSPPPPPPPSPSPSQVLKALRDILIRALDSTYLGVGVSVSTLTGPAPTLHITTSVADLFVKSKTSVDRLDGHVHPAPKLPTVPVSNLKTEATTTTTTTTTTSKPSSGRILPPTPAKLIARPCASFDCDALGMVTMRSAPEFYYYNRHAAEQCCTWEPFYYYGSWGACSAVCDRGTQTRCVCVCVCVFEICCPLALHVSSAGGKLLSLRRVVVAEMQGALRMGVRCQQG